MATHKANKLKIVPILSAALLLHIIMIIFIANADANGFENPSPKCIFYNLGDSNTDTGSFSAVSGKDLNHPYGKSFFHNPTVRMSDGRVYLDFICESLEKNYLSAYPEPLGSNFSGGANFATSWATAAEFNGSIFSLRLQVEQLGHFQKRTLKLALQDLQIAIKLYLVDIGQNDLSNMFTKNMSYQRIVDEIPRSIGAIEGGIKALYNLGGARKFWVSNTGPLGCLPSNVKLAKGNNIAKLDKVGCVSMYNDVAQIFNRELGLLCNRMKSGLKDARIVYVDLYKIKHDLFANPGEYGFEDPLISCCSSCANPPATVCPDPSKSVVWDDIHFTEAAHAAIASRMLSGKYSTPKVKLETLCGE